MSISQLNRSFFPFMNAASLTDPHGRSRWTTKSRHQEGRWNQVELYRPTTNRLVHLRRRSNSIIFIQVRDDTIQVGNTRALLCTLTVSSCTCNIQKCLHSFSTCTVQFYSLWIKATATRYTNDTSSNPIPPSVTVHGKTQLFFFCCCCFFFYLTKVERLDSNAWRVLVASFDRLLKSQSETVQLGCLTVQSTYVTRQQRRTVETVRRRETMLYSATVYRYIIQVRLQETELSSIYK